MVYLRRTPIRALKVLTAFVIAQPALALLHEMLVVGTAFLLHGLSSSDAFYQFVKQFLASPVHAKIMTETLGGVEVQGVAVASLPGQLLHQILPWLFLEPELTAPGTWISAVIQRDSAVLGVLATQSLVEMILIVFGVLLASIGLQRKNLWDVLKWAPSRNVLSALLGLYIVAQAIWAMFGLTLAPRLSGLRDTGIGVGFSLLLQLDSQRYDWLMDESLPTAIPSLLSATGLITALLLRHVLGRVNTRFLKRQEQTVSRNTRLVNQALLLTALAIMLALLALLQRYFGTAMTHPVDPVQVQAVASETVPTAVLPTETLPASASLPTAMPTSVATPTWALTVFATAEPPVTRALVPSPTPMQPTQVDVRRVEGKFRLIVNGQPTTVTGMNYNVNYTALPDEVKRSRHRRDFRVMRDARVNAVIGWGVYDELTLEVAQEFGIGVFMPFEMDAQGAYENRNYRDHVKSEYRGFVKRYQRFPALWGWNPGGDELLHRMDTEHHRTPDKLQAASDFLLELSELAFSLDPAHVSIVKEPRDWYVPYIEESIRKARAKPQPDPSAYFIFAVNTYGKPDGVSLVLNNVKRNVGDRQGIPLAVGEFAPFGLARSDRPQHYVMMWEAVQEASSIGGFAYVFGPDQPNPNGPNPYDPLRLLVNPFSFVDMDGNPVDGSLCALAAKWSPSRECSVQPSVIQR